MKAIWIPNAIVRVINYEPKNMNIIVDTNALTLTFGNFQTRCSIGRSGACDEADKREGDGCTPLGLYPLRAAIFNPERSKVVNGMKLPWRWSRANDGWSDGTADPCYNRPIFLPHRYSAETLRRDDPLYDIIIILGHNDDPPISGSGSAIFFHLWNHEKPLDERTTEGCVAISRDAMIALLPQLSRKIMMQII